jgi:hypothetical protein
MKQLMHTRLLRDDVGLKLELKSEVNFGALFKTSSVLVGGVEIRARDELVSWPPTAVWLLKASLFDTATLSDNHSPKINAAFLGAVGLANGVAFDLGNRPMSADRLRRFVTEFNELVKTVYRLYLKPVNLQVTITTSESEVVA